MAGHLRIIMGCKLQMIWTRSSFQKSPTAHLVQPLLLHMDAPARECKKRFLFAPPEVL